MSKVTLNDLIVGAKTVYGEARGESAEGRVAVACVIRNRFKRKWRRAGSVAEVCLAPWQFSCWNRDDPNSRILVEETFDCLGTDFYGCLDSMRYVLIHDGFDPTNGATHYHHRSIRPNWSVGKEPCYKVGNHWFYNNIQ